MKKWVAENVQMEVVRRAKEQRHAVLITPPHYSDFQPIELIQALINGTVGRQYERSTNLSDVHYRLQQQFESLQTTEGSDKIRKCIEYTSRVLK